MEPDLYSTSQVFQHKKLKITPISKTKKKQGFVSVSFVKRDCQHPKQKLQFWEFSTSVERPSYLLYELKTLLFNERALRTTAGVLNMFALFF